MLDVSPMALLKPPTKEEREVQPMVLSQIDEVVAQVQRGNMPERDTAIIYLLLDAGLRSGECVSLKVGDVEPFTNRILVKQGKGSKDRTVYMGLECGRALWACLAKVGERPPTDPLFEATDGGHLQPNGLGQIIRKAGRSAGIEGVRCSPHTARHTYAVTTLEGGASDIYLMRFMGHKTLTTTTVYANFVKASMQRQHAQHSPADKLRPVPKKKGRPRGAH